MRATDTHFKLNRKLWDRKAEDKTARGYASLSYSIDEDYDEADTIQLKIVFSSDLDQTRFQNIDWSAPELKDEYLENLSDLDDF